MPARCPAPPGNRFLATAGVLSTLTVLLSFAISGPVRAQWARVEVLPMAEVSAVFADDGILLAGSGSAVYISTDGGYTWSSSELPGNGVDGIWAFARAHGRLYAGTLSHGVFVSADEGASWTSRNEGLEGTAARAVTKLVSLGDDLYAGTSGAGVFVLNLTTASSRWEPFRDGLGDRVGWDITALVAAENRLLAGAGANGYVFIRNRSEPSWTGVPFVPFDPSGPMMLDVVVASGRFIGGSTHGLFHSLDGGLTWTRHDIGLGYLQQVALAVADDAVYAAPSKGFINALWVSTDAGNTWTELERNPGPLTYDLATQGGRLFAARLDGLWHRSLTGTSVEPPPAASFLRLALSPNPTSGPVQIQVDLAVSADVSLSVHDATGRQIAVLASGAWPAGMHNAFWDATSLASGIYFVRLRSGTNVQTDRLILVR